MSRAKRLHRQPNARYFHWMGIYCPTCNTIKQVCTRCGRDFCDYCEHTVHDTQPPLCMECYFHPQKLPPSLVP
jgi:hypothetical protein